jgi:hypothetical protein
MKIGQGWELIAILLFLLGTSVQAGHTECNSPATLQVTILDDHGSLVHSAHIYIFSEDKMEFFGTREAYGTTTFDLPAGRYRLYAAMALKTDDVLDHYASPEAKICVASEEANSIVLPLQRGNMNEMILSDTARQQLNIDPALANYLN